MAPDRGELRPREPGRTHRVGASRSTRSPRSLNCCNLPSNKDSQVAPSRPAWDFLVSLVRRCDRMEIVAADSSRVPHLGTGVPRYPWVGVGVGARFPSLARMGDLGLQLPKLQFFFGGATFPHFRSFATKHRPPERNRSSFQSKHRKRGLTPPDPMRSNARIAGQPGAMSREIVNDFHPMQLPNR